MICVKPMKEEEFRWGVLSTYNAGVTTFRQPVAIQPRASTYGPTVLVVYTLLIYQKVTGSTTGCSKCFLCRLLVVVAFIATTTGVAYSSDDYVVYNILEDGELETRIHNKGITAKEVTVGGGEGIKFRQLSDGKHFIQLIYDEEDKIVDCEYVRNADMISSFITKWQRDVHELQTVFNATLIKLNDIKVPGKVTWWSSYKKLKGLCKQNHQQIKKVLKHRNNTSRITTETGRRNRRSLSRYLLVPGTLWCGHSTAASKYTHLGAMSRVDQCCRKHDHCPQLILGFSYKYGMVNNRPFTISSCHCDKRSRRDLGNLLRIPGTKWCGKGRSASKYTDVGMFTTTDKCCRRHDSACPFWISGFQSKYGLMNWRVNTIMHCHCDESFRTCLKRVGSSDANLVGKLFFNVVQTKCFVFKPKKTCVKRSWWGKCLKKKYEKQAVLRDNISY